MLGLAWDGRSGRGFILSIVQVTNMSADVQPITVLRVFVANYPTQIAAAAALGIKPSYLTDLLYGRRLFSANILKKLGLKRMIVREGVEE